MHGVLGLWTMDFARRDSQEHELRERIVPRVSNAPGFVRGAWAREVGGNRSVSFIVFDDESSARDFMRAVRDNAGPQKTAGVANDELVLVELDAEAGGTREPNGHPPG
jgi:hypothetical protein